MYIHTDIDKIKYLIFPVPETVRTLTKLSHKDFLISCAANLLELAWIDLLKFTLYFGLALIKYFEILISYSKVWGKVDQF